MRWSRKTTSTVPSCRYCGYVWTEDTLTTIEHLRSHAGIFAEQGLHDQKMADLDRWEWNVRRAMETDKLEEEILQQIEERE